MRVVLLHHRGAFPPPALATCEPFFASRVFVYAGSAGTFPGTPPPRIAVEIPARHAADPAQPLGSPQRTKCPVPMRRSGDFRAGSIVPGGDGRATGAPEYLTGAPQRTM